jgi:hypothetical protein
MSKTLEEIRKKLQALDTRKGPAGGGNSDKTTYPHWNIPEGTSAIIRLLPDANEDNSFFWVEKQMIKLPFRGIKGHDEFKPIEIQVPCIEMWDGKNKCPILNEVRPMWKDPSLEATARKYWIKKTYYMQGFVKTDPIGETDAPENPIRKFMITNQIFAIIKAALMDTDMTESPVDYINGTDFIINKTSKGGFADYGTSKWARKESSLTEEMQDAIAQYGLVDLSTYLPKRPTPEQQAVMFDMFQASLDGELYDPVAWAQHFKPYGFDAGPSRNDAEPKAPVPARSVQVPVTKPAVVNEEQLDTDDNDPPFDGGSKTESAPQPETAGATAAKSPQEILAMLRNRNK